MANSKKDKKISFQLYLEGKPTSVIDDEEYYKLYLRINFNGDSTKMPPMRDHHDYEAIYWRKEDLENWQSGNYHLLDEEVVEMIKEKQLVYEKFIRHEYAKEGDQYLLKGISQRAQLYDRRVSEFLFDQIEFIVFVSEAIKDENIGLHSLKERTNIIKKIIQDEPITNEGYLATLIELFVLLREKNKLQPDDDILEDSIFSYIAQKELDNFTIFMKKYFDGYYDESKTFEKHELINKYMPKKEKQKVYLNTLFVCVNKMRWQLGV